MAFTLIKNMQPPGPTMFYDPKFRHILEMHLNQLKMYGTRKTLLPEELYQYEGDFNGFLYQKGVLPHMHWLYTRVNGMTNPNQFGKSLRDAYNKNPRSVWIEPIQESIAELQQYWLTVKK